MKLLPWTQRTQEEAFHFNPAYMGALLYEFVKSYSAANQAPSKYVLPFCAMPLALYPDCRRLLPNSVRTGLYSWLERTPEALVGYADRARYLVPYLKEGLLYAAARQAIQIEDGMLKCGTKKASFSESHLNTVTTDLRDTVRSVRMTGKWFAAAGSEQTILTSLGVRP
ncbi:MAG: DUF6521 family protein [Hyphomonas sp.]